MLTPFWDTHKASELLEVDEESGRAKELKPKALWESRKENQDFPLCVFASTSTNLDQRD